MLLEKVVGKNEWKMGFWCMGGVYVRCHTPK